MSEFQDIKVLVVGRYVVNGEIDSGLPAISVSLIVLLAF